eukprot:TRINITY_DN23427_c0_g1_i1.p1 TRINITY_DN23427_c0_g1~~TRINITY_DN23427_c0_g1_i1.p1  ORF type:complete len:298 (+),score=48.37 TRINITY_DN23427_c0_g1_i1:1-894(+)
MKAISSLISFVFCVSLSEGCPDHQCSLPLDVGPCRLSLPAFYFNTETNRCESFSFGGCQGNSNRFDTLKDCQLACHQSSQDDALNPSLKSETCKEPPTSGENSCEALIPKFTFNYESLSCESYNYGGCFGTENLYDSITECMGACIHGTIGFHKQKTPSTGERNTVCSLHRDGDPNKTCFASIPKWTFDQGKGRCAQYIYGGCGATANSFDSEEECEAACPATSPKPEVKSGFVRPAFCSKPTYINEGPAICLLLSRGYTFNSDKGSCEFIEFGGCGATENFFESNEKCQETCEGLN